MRAAAYGFAVEGLAADGRLALHGAERWPLLRIERDPGLDGGAPVRVLDDELVAVVPAARPEDELLHPVLAYATLLLAERRGVDAMHAGAVLGPDGAWAFVGAKEAGKSTLLAHLALAGATVLADDVLVLDGVRCLAGPRFVDLRPPAARRVPAAATARGGTRSRVPLPPAPAESELAGLVHLAWGSDVALEPLAAPERLRRLLARREEDRWPADPGLLLDLAALPAFELRRPRRWAALGACGEALEPLASLSASAA